MKHPLLIFFLIFSSLHAFSQNDSNDSLEIAALLKNDYGTMQSWDAEKHIGNCTPDYLLVENGEIWDLATEIKSYRENANRVLTRTDSFFFKTIKVFPEMAYAVYKTKSVIKENNKQVIKVWNESASFRKINGQWKIALIHSTPLISTEYAIFDHVALYVRSLEKSVAFYKALFQFDTIPVPAHGNTKVTWFQMNKTLQLHLVEGAKDSVTIPFTHIAFTVASINDFTEKLKRANIYLV